MISGDQSYVLRHTARVIEISSLTAFTYSRSVSTLQMAVIFLHGGIRMFDDLGVSKGTTVLAGLSLIGIPGTIVLYTFGARLRARSRYAA